VSRIWLISAKRVRPAVCAELVSHPVFANPDPDGARELLASVLEKLGYGSENATWRNSFLTGAQELRTRKVQHTDLNSAGLAPAPTVTQLFDAAAIRINGPKAWSEHLTNQLEPHWRRSALPNELSNGAVIHFPTTEQYKADLTVTLTKPQLLELLMAGKADGVVMVGDVLTAGVGKAAHTGRP
jgi:alkyl sulfatase BDS1-like metallo-beta-lactamase superfamily hydrolase